MTRLTAPLPLLALDTGRVHEADGAVVWDGSLEVARDQTGRARAAELAAWANGLVGRLVGGAMGAPSGNDGSAPMGVPFDNSSVAVDGLTIESAADRVAVYGRIIFHGTVDGIGAARRLASYSTALRAALEAEAAAGRLPERVEVVAPTVRANPLA